MCYTQLANQYGPLLFLIYINNLEHESISAGSVINLFTNDSLFY